MTARARYAIPIDAGVRARGRHHPEPVGDAAPPVPDCGISVHPYWASSKDGTHVPYFLIRPRNATGPVPTILYGQNARAARPTGGGPEQEAMPFRALGGAGCPRSSAMNQAHRLLVGLALGHV